MQDFKALEGGRMAILIGEAPSDMAIALHSPDLGSMQDLNISSPDGRARGRRGH